MLCTLVVAVDPRRNDQRKTTVHRDASAPCSVHRAPWVCRERAAVRTDLVLLLDVGIVGPYSTIKLYKKCRLLNYSIYDSLYDIKRYKLVVTVL